MSLALAFAGTFGQVVRGGLARLDDLPDAATPGAAAGVVVAALVGVAGGLVGGRVHHVLLARAVAAALDRRGSALLIVSAPLRLLVPAAVLFALAQWRLAALVGGFVGLALALVWARARPPAAASGPAPRPSAEESAR
ncbi:MAG: hypothetical protein R3A79_27010 [Nannocystaceae bacterium]